MAEQFPFYNRKSGASEVVVLHIDHPIDISTLWTIFSHHWSIVYGYPFHCLNVPIHTYCEQGTM